MTKQLNANITDNLDEEFRKMVAKTIGVRKGAIADALTEALEQWIEEKEKNVKQ